MNRIIIVFIAVVILIQCRKNESLHEFDNYDASSKIEREQFYISNISIDTNKKDVITFLGLPDSIQFSFDEVVADSSEYLYYEGLEIYLVGRQVFEIKCWSDKYSTEDSIKVGSTKEQLIRTYGPSKAIQTSDGERISYWVRGTDTKLFFYLKKNRVVLIHFWFNYV